MTEAGKRAICIGEAMHRTRARRRRPLRAGVLRRHLQHRDLSGARRVPVAFASALGDDPYSDAIVALAYAEGIGTELILRDAGRLPGLALVDADGKGGRRVALLARGRAGTRTVRAAELEPRRRRPDRRAADLFFRHHAVALFQCRPRPVSRRRRARAQQRRQDRLRRKFPPARLERRSHPHAHRVRRGAQARRYRAAGL